MQAIRTRLKSYAQFSAYLWTAMFLFATFSVSGVEAIAQHTVPPVVISQSNLIIAYPNSPAINNNVQGSNIGVSQKGQIFFGDSYNSDLFEYDPSTGTATKLGSPGQVTATAVDPSNNFYFAQSYGTTLIKIPYVHGAYATFNGSPSAPCTGHDTAACYVNNLTNSANSYYFQFVNIAFDQAGNLFYEIGENSSIYECDAVCLAGGNNSALVYLALSGGAVPGGLAFDSAGNMFFADYTNGGGPSHLNELVYTSGTGFAATPIALYTLAGTGSNWIDAVTVGKDDTVYFGQNQAGILALPNNAGVVDPTQVYQVSTQNAEILALDQNGNLVVSANPIGSNNYSTNTLYRVTLTSLTAAATTFGTPSTTALATFLNSTTCGSAPTVTYSAAIVSTSGSQPTTEFSASDGTCITDMAGHAELPTTLTFTPASAGTRKATLTATDNSGNTISSIVTGSSTGGPVFTPPPGTYTTPQAVAITDSTAGATFFYTTDGSTPTQGSTPYTGPVLIPVTETLEAIAVVGGTPSAVASGLYTIIAAAPPSFSPPGGLYAAAQTVAISDVTPGAVIYYTTDGTTPTTSSAVYNAPLDVSSTETIKAFATAPGFNQGPVTTAIYTIVPPSPAPVFTPAGGTYTTGQVVTISDAVPGTTFYYTTDGSTPTVDSTLYLGIAIPVSANETIQAIATGGGHAPSPVGAAVYVIAPVTLDAPTISLAAGTYPSAQMVTITDATPTATIYYTTDGSTPTTSSSVYAAPITVSQTETITAVAVQPGFITSPATSAAYKINLPAQTFTVGVSSGTASAGLGAPATVTVVVTPQNGFNQTVTFACAGLPAGGACIFSPASVTPSGDSPIGTSLLLAADQVPPTTTASNPHGSLYPGAVLAVALGFFGFRKRRRMKALLLLIVGTAAITLVSGCSSGSSSTSSTTAKGTTSMITVTATSGTLQSSASIAFTVIN